MLLRRETARYPPPFDRQWRVAAGGRHVGPGIARSTLEWHSTTTSSRSDGRVPTGSPSISPTRGRWPTPRRSRTDVPGADGGSVLPPPERAPPRVAPPIRFSYANPRARADFLPTSAWLLRSIPLQPDYENDNRSDEQRDDDECGNAHRPRVHGNDHDQGDDRYLLAKREEVVRVHVPSLPRVH